MKKLYCKYTTRVNEIIRPNVSVIFDNVLLGASLTSNCPGSF